MATTRYANSAGSNTAPYDTFAKGATDPQTVLDLHVAGDTFYIGGTFGSGTTFIIKSAGDFTNGYPKIIGVNPSTGVVDGSRAVLDGENISSTIISTSGVFNMQWIENIECKRSVADLVTPTGVCYHWILKNCKLHLAGSDAFNTTNLRRVTLEKCEVVNNTSRGVYLYDNSRAYSCTISGNGEYGAALGISTMVINCLIAGNASGAVMVASHFPLISGCILDGWTGAAPGGIGILNTTYVAMRIFATRITNFATGISISGAGSLYTNWCGFYGNTTKSTVAGAGYWESGSDDIDMADDGYVGGRGGGVTGNFNLKNGATPAELRWTEIDIDGVNKTYIPAGLGPNPDFPVKENVVGDTTDGVTGTFDEAARNKFNAGSSVADLLTGKSVKLLNVDNDGTYTPALPPGVPQNCIATPFNSTRIDVEWDEAANINTYVLEHSTNGTDWSVLVTLTGATFASSYSHTGLSPNTAHFYRVKASGAGGTSAYSNSFWATTLQGNAVDTVRTKIREAIVYNLGLIKTADGYYNTVQKVCDPPESPAQLKTKLPAINVAFGPEECENVNMGRGSSGEGNEAKIFNSFILSLECYLSEKNNPSRAQERILADVQKRFLNFNWIPDSDGNATIFVCMYAGSEPWGLKLNNPNCGISINIKVWYRQALTDPTVRM